MTRIAGFWAKYKARAAHEGETLVLPAIVLLVALAAFGLGRLSAMGEGRKSAEAAGCTAAFDCPDL